MSEIEALPCEDKLRFDSKVEADAMSVSLRHRYDTKYRSYKCRHCGLWHLATNFDD